MAMGAASLPIAIVLIPALLMACVNFYFGPYLRTEPVGASPQTERAAWFGILFLLHLALNAGIYAVFRWI